MVYFLFIFSIFNNRTATSGHKRRFPIGLETDLRLIGNDEIYEATAATNTQNAVGGYFPLCTKVRLYPPQAQVLVTVMLALRLGFFTLAWTRVTRTLTFRLLFVTISHFWLFSLLSFGFSFLLLGYHFSCVRILCITTTQLMSLPKY